MRKEISTNWVNLLSQCYVEYETNSLLLRPTWPRLFVCESTVLPNPRLQCCCNAPIEVFGSKFWVAKRCIGCEDLPNLNELIIRAAERLQTWRLENIVLHNMLDGATSQLPLICSSSCGSKLFRVRNLLSILRLLNLHFFTRSAQGGGFALHCQSETKNYYHLHNLGTTHE